MLARLKDDVLEKIIENVYHHKMKAEKKKIVSEMCFSCAYGCLIGYELSLQFENEDLLGLGHLMLIGMCPIIFQQSASYTGN